ncbi:hypothetical protein PpBr36_00177 [Pyricularia pennisetigena]|uniref:hypothetical protein n=1 Tax=Pyricularia pennisetigena TaxID=1578925 RepID=UPI001150F4D6|nr:hypothetical protein PpBr36_00177 [Pyricularia pennisetigena]TLS28267.1 hypothetical protein PpBr36_00177 [Pyricularia pennisetigena]
MPPTLDLSGATHSKMMVVPPRLNLRRAASYQGEKGPLSSTSSRFSFNHLVFASPPPSPRLPTLVPPRPRKASNPPRPSRVFKTLLFVAVAVGMVYFSITAVCGSRVTIPWLEPEPEQFEMVGQAGLPDFPTPIVFHDKRGNPKWTVFIPLEQPFPLSMQGYADMVSMCRGVSMRVNDLHNPGRAADTSHHNPSKLVSGDAHFVDVEEAEAAKLLPGAAVGYQKGETPVCTSSLTYVLESTDAGIGKSLMMMWTAYGLAQRQGRAFFVDDTRWAYGKYTDIFNKAPEAGCRAPRKHEILPCPYQARHLLVNFATVEGYVSASLGEQPSTGPVEQMSSDRQRERFDLARTGYEALFHLNAQDTEYVKKRTAELRGQTRALPGQRDGLVVGLHVRRGDRHPLEYQYRDSYLPFTAYAEMAKKLLAGNEKQSVKILASDDPMVYESDDFSGTARAQELIKLASKTAIQQVNPNSNRGVMHKFVDDTFGWEGGFFAAMFWNLGLSSTSAAHSSHKQAVMATKGAASPSADTARLRSYMGRAYMMDLAVLADASDAVVCTVSAMGCRLLGVMMGWERAFENGKWVNIDGDYGWGGGTW